MNRKLKDVVSKARTIDKDRRLSYAIEEMKKYNIAKLPVTEEGELVGIITERDIVDKLGSSRSLNMRTSSFHVSSCMTSEPFTLSGDDTVEDALLAFKSNDFSGIPVLGEDIGIITKTDMLNLFDIKGYVSENLDSTFEILRPDERVIHARRLLLDGNLHSLPVWGEGLLGIVTIQDIVFGLNEFREKTPGKYMEKRLKEFTIDHIMSTDSKTAKLEDSLNDVKKILIENNFSSMPVLNFEEHIVGLISKDELIKAI